MSDDIQKTDCACEKTRCGCAAVTASRCECGETCACQKECRCASGCGCGVER